MGFQRQNCIIHGRHLTNRKTVLIRAPNLKGFSKFVFYAMLYCMLTNVRFKIEIVRAYPSIHAYLQPVVRKVKKDLKRVHMQSTDGCCIVCRNEQHI